jgi:glucokinase
MDTFTIGIDLGGTNLRIAAYSPNGASDGQSGVSKGSAASQKFLSRIDLRSRVSDGPQSVVREIAEQIRILIERHSRYTLVGIGLGTPGPLELPAGILHAPPNLPGWDRFALRAELELMLDRAVHVESDANLAALAEFALGAGAACSVESLCMLTLGTGVGHAIILSGAIWSGAHGMAGEAGHTTVWPDGLPCNCGNTGCLELYASATGVRRMAEEAIQSGSAPGLKAWRESGGTLEAQAIYRLALQKDPDALRIFSTVGTALGIALGSLINTLDLRLYVIGGGLAGAWDFFSPAMFSEMDRRSYVYRLANERISDRRIQVFPAMLGSDSGLLGAALLGIPVPERLLDLASGP